MARGRRYARLGEPAARKERTDDRDKPLSPASLRAHTLDLAVRLPKGEILPLYPAAGHGAIFQYHDEVVTKALEFLDVP